MTPFFLSEFPKKKWKVELTNAGTGVPSLFQKYSFGQKQGLLLDSFGRSSEDKIAQTIAQSQENATELEFSASISSLDVNNPLERP